MAISLKNLRATSSQNGYKTSNRRLLILSEATASAEYCSTALQLVNTLTYPKCKLICHSKKSPQSDQIMRNTALAWSTRIKAYSSSLLFNVSNFGLFWKACCILERLGEIAKKFVCNYFLVPFSFSAIRCLNTSAVVNMSCWHDESQYTFFFRNCLVFQITYMIPP